MWTTTFSITQLELQELYRYWYSVRLRNFQNGQYPMLSAICTRHLDKIRAAVETEEWLYKIERDCEVEPEAFGAIVDYLVHDERTNAFSTGSAKPEMYKAVDIVATAVGVKIDD